MSEVHRETPEPEPDRTGVPEVDAVLGSLAGLETTEVADHPAIFQSAHERLRRALDAGGS